MSLDAIKQALDAFEDAQRHNYALKHKETDELITVLRAAIEQAERPQTHSEECWRWHHQCAVAKIERGNT